MKIEVNDISLDYLDSILFNKSGCCPSNSKKRCLSSSEKFTFKCK